MTPSPQDGFEGKVLVQCAWCGVFFDAAVEAERREHMHMQFNGKHLTSKHIEAIGKAAMALNSAVLREAFEILSYGE